MRWQVTSHLRSLASSTARCPSVRECLRVYARTTVRHKSSKSGDDFQAKSLDGFYADLLRQPLQKVAPAAAAAAAEAAPLLESDLPSYNWLPKTVREETIAKARVVFGSRSDPSDRRRELEASSRKIAGVLVPPRPTEPDNCCMSGCVNCVWDQYRDELEEWVAKSAEARAKMEAQRTGDASRTQSGQGQAVAASSSMDDDGGGSDTNWIDSGATAGKDLFDDVPVGIREFMKNEKRLKERRLREAQSNS